MKRPAVFFDRDNTLIVSEGYLGDPAGVVLVDGAPDAVARARQYGFVVVTFSNQSGVARGLFDEDAVHAVNQRIDELLQQANPSAIITRHEFCPFHPDATVEQYRQDSPLRKPQPGMIFAAAEKLNLDLARSWVIGDTPRDIEAGKAAGCRTILFRDPSLAPSPAADAPFDVAPDYSVSSLREAIDIIAREAFKPGQTPRHATAPPPQAAADQPTQAPDTAAPAQPVPAGTPLAPAPIAVTENPTAEAPSDAELEGEPAGPAAQVPPEEIVSARHADAVPQQPASMVRLEKLAEQILTELRLGRGEDAADFSVSKLMAGIVQVLALAVLFLAYLNREDPSALQATLLFAIFLQVLTVALLIMGRQR